MFVRKGAGIVLSMGLVAFAFGADAPTTKPASSIKLVKPWSSVTSLTDDQRQKIHDIHEKANDDRKEIDSKEKADIMAVLTDEQKAELKKNHADDLADKKMSKAEKAKDEK